MCEEGTYRIYWTLRTRHVLDLFINTATESVVYEEFHLKLVIPIITAACKCIKISFHQSTYQQLVKFFCTILLNREGNDGVFCEELLCLCLSGCDV